jgi:hypothetical protein
MRREKGWQTRWEGAVMTEAGVFLNWCEAVGATWGKKGFRLPEEPPVEAIRAALLGTFDTGEEGPPEEVKAKLAAFSDEQLMAWMRGFAYSFFAHVDVGGEGGAA